MKLTFPKSTCKYLQHIVREVHNQELTQEIRLSDGMPDIGRVLGTWGQVILRSKEWRSDAVAFSGGIMAWVLYIPEDGTDIRCAETWIPFQMEWDIPSGMQEGDIRILPLLRFVDGRSTSARKVMVRAGIAAQAEAWLPMEQEIPRAEDLDEDIQLLKKEYPVRMAQEAGEKTFQLDEEFELPPSCPAADKLLAYTVHPEVTEKRVSGNRLILKGNGNLHLIYRGEEGQLYSCDCELPFSQLVNLEESDGDDPQVDIQLAVTSLELDLSDGGQLRLKCGLVVQYLIHCRRMMQVVEDAYSLRREVDTLDENLYLPAILESREETVFGEQMIPQSAGRIVDVTFLPDFPRQHRMANQVELVIPGQLQVLYYGEDGTVQSATSRWEGNYRIGADEDSRIYASVYPRGRSQAYQSGGQIQLKPEITLGLETESQQGIPMVSGLEVGQQKVQDAHRPSLILQRAGEGGLWAIAKKAGTTVDAIRDANGLTGEPAENQMLLIPVS